MRRVLIPALALIAALAAGAAQAADFRIAAPAASTAPCAPVGAGGAPGEAAYYEHLSRRLERRVLRCPFANPAEAAKALAAGQVEMAWLDPASYPAVSGQVRAILTVRAASQANRIPVYVAVRVRDGAKDLAGLKGKTVVFGDRSPAGLDAPQAVLTERDLPPSAYRLQVAHDGDSALADLRAGKVDAAAVHAAAWQRVCRMATPKDPEPCRDLRVLLVARPRAAAALAVRRDLPLELRYRVIGIHMALHLEAPAAFAYAAGGVKDPAEFQPSEAEALTLAPLS